MEKKFIYAGSTPLPEGPIKDSVVLENNVFLPPIYMMAIGRKKLSEKEITQLENIIRDMREN